MTATSVLTPSSVVMRAARGSDGAALARLARLDSKPAPRGEVLVAEVDGAIHAALQLDRGVVYADPFRRTADLVEILRAQTVVPLVKQTRRHLSVRRGPALAA